MPPSLRCCSSLLVLVALAACAAEPKVAAIDEADRRVYARQGLDPVIGRSLDDAAEMAARSPTHRVQTRRLERAVASGEAAPLAMPAKPLPEVLGWGGSLPEADALPPASVVREGRSDLASLITVALHHNGEIARAAEATSGAEIAAVNAVFAYLPRASVVGEYSHVFQDVIDSDNQVFQKGTADFAVVNLQSEIRQPVIDFARLFGIREADTGRSVARATYLGVVQGAVFNLVNAYVAALDNKRRLESVESRIALLAAQIEAEERLLAAGRTVPSARQLLEIEQGSAALERTEYAENLALALAELSRIVGRPVTDVTDFTLPDEVWRAAGRAPVEEYLAAALQDNPLIKQRRIETLRARQLYQQSLHADFSPTLEAFARQEYEDREESRFGGGSETLDHTFGLQLTIPLFNTRGDGYRHREQLSAMRQSVIAEAQLRRELEGEIPTLIMRLDAQRRSLRDAEAAVAAAERLVRSAEIGVETGMSPDFAVIMQQLQLERATEWAWRARFTFIRSWVRLAYLTGSDALVQIPPTAVAAIPAGRRIAWLADWQGAMTPPHQRFENLPERLHASLDRPAPRRTDAVLPAAGGAPVAIASRPSPHAHWQERRSAAGIAAHHAGDPSTTTSPHALWDQAPGDDAPGDEAPVLAAAPAEAVPARLFPALERIRPAAGPPAPSADTASAETRSPLASPRPLVIPAATIPLED